MKKKPKKKVVKKKVKTPKKSNPFIWLGAALLVTLIAMLPIFGTELLNYDDELYISQNPFIQSFNIKALFTEFYQNQYSPFAMTLMAIQYKLGLGTGTLKGISLLWHLLNVALVFLVIQRLFQKQNWAFFVAALFGVCTLQVEAVAWLTASMKIGTYAFFFLCALYFYVRYTEKQEKKWLGFAFGAFVLSCLCKEQAVAFTPTLLLVDYYKNRNWLSTTVLVEKIPFLIVSVLFGILTLQASAASEAQQTVFQYGFGERLLFALYTLGAYLTKMIAPFNLSFFYTYPIKGAIPVYFYVYAAIAIAILAVLVQAIRRQNKTVIFALLFFAFNIGLTIFTQLLSVRDVIMADRYVYIPAIGWFLFLAYVLEKIISPKIGQAVAQYIGLGLILILAVSTYNRTNVFKDSITVFSDVIEKEEYSDKKNPYLALPYNNLGIAYKRTGDVQTAFQYFEKSINSGNSYARAFLNRGNIYFNAGDNNKALQDYNRTIELEPSNAKAYSGRGAINAQNGQLDVAMQDFNKAIELDPYFTDALSNRGLVYMQQQNYEASLADFSKILSFDPKAHDILSTRGVVYDRAGKQDLSIQDHTKAIQLQPNNGNYYLNRSYVYNKLGKRNLAKQDALTAKQLGTPVSQEYLNGLNE